MSEQEFRNLKECDIVRHKTKSEAYIVTGNYGGRVTAVRTIDLTNPAEWDLIYKAQTGEERG